MPGLHDHVHAFFAADDHDFYDYTRDDVDELADHIAEYIREHYVERPRWHVHDDYRGGFHDHAGTTIAHAHIESTGSVLYHEGARLIPGPGDTDSGAAP